jgi:hypothetical protein
MRKPFVIAMLLTILFANTYAQQKIRFSVFANPCINWLQSDNKSVVSGSSAIGFDAGLTVDKYFAENYAFSSGISITSLGGNLSFNDPVTFKNASASIVGASVKYKLQYITVPLGIKLKTKQIGYFTYFANLGFNLQMNIRAIGTSNDGALNDNISNEVNLLNLGYFFSAGAEYSLGGNTSAIFGLTYSNGFIDITNNDNAKITTSGLALRLGLMF